MANLNSREIPTQEEGKQADIVETINASGSDEAKLLFLQARNRLFDIDHWSDISKGLSAKFVLTDQYGNPKKGIPEVHDHFRIDIPGPGTSAGEGFDWVCVEMVEDNKDPDSDTEYTLVKVRPSEDPVKQDGVAHFLQEKATSSFIVKREGSLITAAVYGRNEKPNTEAKKLSDKIRNTVIGTAAVIGISAIQWQKLVRGLLNTS